MYKVSSNGERKIEIKGVPDVYYRGQGGLLDVEIHPNFEENNFVYISYSDVIDKLIYYITVRYIYKVIFFKIGMNFDI